MTGLIDALYKRILLAAHPVGSIYQSTEATSPATLFGGTWQAIEGRFLLAAGGGYAAGSTGGEAAHTLTADEMPCHSHAYDRQPYGYAEIQDIGQVLAEKQSTAAYVTGATKEAGGGQSHNNLPPYLVVYAWKRTA